MKLKSVYKSFPIYTERLKISSLSSSMIKWYANETHREYFTEFSDNKSIRKMSKLEIKAKLLSLISTYKSNINFIYEYRTVIFDKESNKPIGGITLFPISFHCIEIGYWIIPEQQHNGYATEALKAIVNHIFSIFSTSDVEGVKLCIQSLNKRSIKMAEKCGFGLVGTVQGSQCVNYIYYLKRELVDN